MHTDTHTHAYTHTQTHQRTPVVTSHRELIFLIWVQEVPVLEGRIDGDMMWEEELVSWDEADH